MQAIRQNLGASYGIHGESTSMTGGSTALSITGSIDNGRLNSALKVLVERWSTFATEAVRDENFGLGRWFGALDRTLDARSSQAMVPRLARRMVRSQTSVELDSWAQTYAELSKADVLEAWRVCRDSVVFSFLGDEATITAALPEGLSKKGE